MSTAKIGNKVTSSMSDEAYERISCFYDGLDLVVRDLAESIAAERNSFIDMEKTTIAIELQDVEEAGRRVTEALRKLLKNGQLPREMEDVISGMDDCLNSS